MATDPSDTEVIIRPAHPRDAAGIADCLDAVARERLWLTATEGFGIHSTDNFIRANLVVGNPHFVAVLPTSVVIGWCDVIPPRPGPEFAHVGQLGIGILDGWRGMGIGRALMNTTLEACAARGFSRIELEVYAHNTRAIALYASLGFVEEGRRIGARILDGVHQDMILMARRSPDAPAAR